MDIKMSLPNGRGSWVCVRVKVVGVGNDQCY